MAGRRSACEPFRAFIESVLAQGLSAQRLYQDLRSEHGFAGGYDAVELFVWALGAAMTLPFRRMEMAPGEEVQVDYGQGAWVIEPDGTRYRPHLLRLVLSASRKGYTEAFRRQTTESFIRGMENGFPCLRRGDGHRRRRLLPRHIIEVLFPATIYTRFAGNRSAERPRNGSLSHIIAKGM